MGNINQRVVSRIAGEFTPAEWEAHKKQHPGADRADHTITKEKPKASPVEDEDLDYDIKHLHGKGKSPADIAKILKQQGVADLSAEEVTKRLPKKAPSKPEPKAEPKKPVHQEEDDEDDDEDDEEAEFIRDLVKDRKTPKQIGKLMSMSEEKAQKLIDRYTKAEDRPKQKSEDEMAEEVASLMKEKKTPKQIQQELQLDESEMKSLIKKRFGPKSKTAATLYAALVVEAFEASTLSDLGSRGPCAPPTRSSKLAQKELEALSPGESTLLRHVRRLKKPVPLRNLSKLPEFHGWDPDSLRMTIDRLQDRGMVSWDGSMVGPSFVKSAEELSDRVADRFVEEL